jgi:protein phosphatase 1 regulatory subunit 7
VQIKSVEPLSSVHGAELVELYCAENKITAIESISHLTRLTVLELGSNRIKVCAVEFCLRRLSVLLPTEL